MTTTTLTTTATSKSNCFFFSKPYGSAHASRLPAFLWRRHCTTTTWNRLRRRFMECLVIRRLGFWTWIDSLGIQLQETSPTFGKLRGVQLKTGVFKVCNEDVWSRLNHFLNVVVFTPQYIYFGRLKWVKKSCYILRGTKERTKNIEFTLFPSEQRRLFNQTLLAFTMLIFMYNLKASDSLFWK